MAGNLKEVSTTIDKAPEAVKAAVEKLAATTLRELSNGINKLAEDDKNQLDAHI